MAEQSEARSYEGLIKTYVDMLHQSNPRGALKNDVCGALLDMPDSGLKAAMHVCWSDDPRHADKKNASGETQPHVCCCGHMWRKAEEGQ